MSNHPDQTTSTDPTTQYDQPEKMDEQIPHPGLTESMADQPDHGEDTYRGSDASREALIGLNQLRLINGQSDLAAVSLREFIATNPDATGPSADGPMPATGAVAALITKATGREPFIVGKPNPMMFRSAMNKIGAHSENTAMIGDRMDTDIISGMEAGMRTVLVLTGISDPVTADRFPFQPTRIVDSVADLIDGVE